MTFSLLLDVLRAFTRYSGRVSWDMPRSLAVSPRTRQSGPGASYNRRDMRALIGLGVVAVLLIAVIGWGVGINNQLVQFEQNVGEKWAQVQNVYQRRADLIPNLVETVKGFATQERTVLEEVTRARASATGVQLTPEALNDPKAMERFQAAQQQLTGALSRLMVTVERYPDLKSNQNFLALQTQLEGTENRIAVERKRFNESVREYNTRLRLFPGSVAGRLAGFQPKAFFAAARQALERRLTERESATGVQMVIAIFPALEGESLEDYSIRLAQQWRIGQKKLDNGVILLVFLDDRKVRLEVGYGLEPVVTDAAAAQIIRENIAPRFREGRYAAGLD